jgi:DNA-binding CsgD family transcriptional regulator
MLVGRDSEMTAVEAALARGRDEGEALAIVGDPGIGKTALLAEARRRGDGFLVLAAAGAERESELPFAALNDLAGPLLDELPALPEPQQEALAGALALRPPTAGDRFAVAVAFHGLLRLHEGPLLVVVDDLHWLDSPSRECIEYVARRPQPGVAVLMAIRDEPPGPPARVPRLDLAGIDDASAVALLTRAAPDLDPAVASDLAGSAAGNPLLLIELAGALSAEQRAGRAALPPLPVPGEGAKRAFGSRIAGLTAEARMALLTIAVHGRGDLAPVVAALRARGADHGAIEELEAAALVRVDGQRVDLVHPLAGAVAYHSADGAARRAAHSALAAALGPDRGAWHLAEASVGPDDAVAGALEQLAHLAAARRAPATAAAALERAARLSADSESRARRLVDAGMAALMAARGAQARAVLAEASEGASSPELKIRATQMLGHAELWGGGGDVTRAEEIFAAAAELLTAGPPGLAAGATADAALAAAISGDCHAALAHAERAADLLAPDADLAARAHVQGLLTFTLVLRGEGRRARPLLEELDRIAESVDPRSPIAQSLVLARNIRLPTEEFGRARAEALEMIAVLRDAGSLTPQVMPSVVAADCALRLGEWERARAELDAAMELADTTGQHGPLAQALTLRSRLDGACAREEEARSAIARALDLARPTRAGSLDVFAYAARGLLELGLGRLDEALAALQEVERRATAWGFEEPTNAPWAPDLVETLVRLGRVGEAEEVQRRLERQAAALGTPGAAALAARCAGIVAADPGDDQFEEALDHHSRSPVVFERGRTLLAYGVKLRRAKRRGDARRRLHEALAVFEALGAATWAKQARAELRLAGGRVRGAGTGLTPAERRVAEVIARGTSNRDAATELFVSQRTVEFHLANAYRKLGVHSRTQLALALRGDGAAGPPPGGDGGRAADSGRR